IAVREAVFEAMEWSVREPAQGDTALLVAQRLSAAHAEAWSDSFLVREVRRFTAWPSAQRAGKIRADSLRRAGNAAWSRDGPASAIAIWRGALRRARAVSDSAGSAALLGNIGAGYLEEGHTDSATLILERARSLAAAVGDARVEANAV